jgi:hypothetical protein
LPKAKPRVQTPVPPKKKKKKKKLAKVAQACGLGFEPSRLDPKPLHFFQK